MIINTYSLTLPVFTILYGCVISFVMYISEGKGGESLSLSHILS